MSAFQRISMHSYSGGPDSEGRQGKLQIYEVSQIYASDQSTGLLSKSGDAHLNSRHTIPRIGLGTWKFEKGQVKHAVYEALKAGYRHVDCAAIYENEREVGAALQQAFAEQVAVREHIFITSKLW